MVFVQGQLGCNDVNLRVERKSSFFIYLYYFYNTIRAIIQTLIAVEQSYKVLREDFHFTHLFTGLMEYNSVCDKKLHKAFVAPEGAVRR